MLPIPFSVVYWVLGFDRDIDIWREWDFVSAVVAGYHAMLEVRGWFPRLLQVSEQHHMIWKSSHGTVGVFCA